MLPEIQQLSSRLRNVFFATCATSQSELNVFINLSRRIEPKEGTMKIGTSIWLFLAFLGPKAIADGWETSAEGLRVAWRQSMREATTLLNQQHREEAARVMESAIRAARNVGQPDDTIAGALNDLGTIYHEIERYADANRCYKQAISILEHCAPSSPKMVTALVNLAGLRVHQLKYSEAEKLYQRAERISDSKLASNSPSLASVLSRLIGVAPEEKKFPRSTRIRRACPAFASGK